MRTAGAWLRLRSAKSWHCEQGRSEIYDSFSAESIENALKGLAIHKSRPDDQYPDDRRDLYFPCVTETQQHLAQSVALIVSGNSFSGEPGKQYLRTKSFQDTYDTCCREPFGSQPVVVHGECESMIPVPWTGVLIHPKLLLTCGHDLAAFHGDGYEVGATLKNTYAAFGYHMANANIAHVAEPHCKIVKVQRCVSASKSESDIWTSKTGDWAIFALETDPCLPVINDFLALESNWIGCQASVYTIGHPMGLPKKLADDALASKMPGTNAFFLANLDTYNGNSGSPVFHGDQLVGLVVRAQRDSTLQDVIPVEECLRNVSHTYKQLGNYGGQQCTAITSVLSQAIRDAIGEVDRDANNLPQPDG